MLRAILPPLITAYALFVAMVALVVRRPVPRSRGLGDGSTRVLRDRVVSTALGGYVAFLVIVLVFHVWLAGEPDAFASAVWGGAFLSGVALLLAWISSRLGRRSGRQP